MERSRKLRDITILCWTVSCLLSAGHQWDTTTLWTVSCLLSVGHQWDISGTSVSCLLSVGHQWDISFVPSICGTSVGHQWDISVSCLLSVGHQWDTKLPCWTVSCHSSKVCISNCAIQLLLRQKLLCHPYKVGTSICVI